MACVFAIVEVPLSVSLQWSVDDDRKRVNSSSHICTKDMGELIVRQQPAIPCLTQLVDDICQVLLQTAIQSTNIDELRTFYFYRYYRQCAMILTCHTYNRLRNVPPLLKAPPWMVRKPRRMGYILKKMKSHHRYMGLRMGVSTPQYLSHKIFSVDELTPLSATISCSSN